MTQTMTRRIAGGAAAALLAAGATLALSGPAAAQNSTAQATVRTIYVVPDDMGLVGADGKHHDTFLPANILLKKGEKVTLVFINHDDMPHSFSDPKLGVNVIVRPGKHVAGSSEVKPTETRYTFTPEKAGQFRWHCAFPCDTGSGKGWAMRASKNGPDRNGFMAGYVVVI